VKHKHTSPVVFYGTIALLLLIGGALVLYLWLSWSLLVSWLVLVNPVTLLFYGFDKMRAKGKGTRIPEKVLQALALLGGSAGGLVAMILFRHKIRKGSFQRVFWAIVALQIAGICVWLVTR